MPLISGTCFVKWYVDNSQSAEHRGRTARVAIKEHKVVWDHEIKLPVRISMDKSNMLEKCKISFEVAQDYASSGARNDKIVLGKLELNLAEYVDESEDIAPDEGGLPRRYLMEESKINSTLRVSIIMKQLDGERNFSTPPLKQGGMFGGIAGIMNGDQGEQDDLGNSKYC